jgi:hypothetical protein
MVSAPSVKAIIESIIALYGILPGDWTQTPLEVASTPVAAPQLPQAPVTTAASRGRGPERKALSARPAPAVSGVRHVAAE